MTDPRDLTAEQEPLGHLSLDVLYDWAAYVKRRVESVQFIDHLRLKRRVSVDVVVPDEGPLTSPHGEPWYWLPLALMRKRPLRNFDLRDAHGRALPVLTREQDGRVAAAVLLAAARARAADRSDIAARAGIAPPVPDPGAVPDAVRKDLWEIAHAAADVAQFRWERLGRPWEADDKLEKAWRTFLIGDREFMALARDLARNFILMTEVAARPGDRMLFKFSYDEEPPQPRLRLRRPDRRLLERLRKALKAATEPEPEPAKGVLHVAAFLASVPQDATPDAAAASKLRPQPDVRVVVTRKDGKTPRVKVTDAQGRTWFELEEAVYTVETLPPVGALELDAPMQRVAVRVAEARAIAFRYRQIAALATGPEAPETAPPERLRHRVLRFVGWRARPIVIQAPGVAHALSYHLEVVAPDELKLTRARFAARPAYWIPSGGDDEPPSVRAEKELGAMQRAHLHLREIDQRFSGVCRVHLRPLETTVVQPATLSAAVSFGLLLILALRLREVAANAGPISTLLLLVPGGLSAYIARQRESQLATQMVLGPRLLALMAGGASLATAAVLVLGRSWTVDPHSHAVVPGPLSTAFYAAIWSLVVLAFVAFVLLAGCWLYTHRMPECREWDPGRRTGAKRPESRIGFTTPQPPADESTEAPTAP